MKAFTKADAVKFAARERKVIDGVVCPDFDGAIQFTVKEPSAMDLLLVGKAGEDYGSGGAPIALISACVVDEKGERCFTFEEAAEFVLGNSGNLEPLFEAISELGITAEEEDADPLD